VSDKEEAGRKVSEQRAAYGPATSPTIDEVRAALGDLVIEVDASSLLRRLGIQGSLPDRETFFNSLPVLSPPVSTTVREERDEGF
jgi:hypothetical protein